MRFPVSEVLLKTARNADHADEARRDPLYREIGNLLPNNRRQRRTCYALCHILYPVSAAHRSIFRMDSNSTSYILRDVKVNPKLSTPVGEIQGYLAYKKHPPTRTLQ